MYIYVNHSRLLSPDLMKQLLWTLDVFISEHFIDRLAYFVNKINIKNLKCSEYIKLNDKVITA
jgi:hypothetical protein